MIMKRFKSRKILLKYMDFPRKSIEQLITKLIKVGIEPSSNRLVFNALFESRLIHGGQERDNFDNVLDGHIWPVVDSCIDFCVAEGKPVTSELVAGAMLHEALEDSHHYMHHPDDFGQTYGDRMYKIVKGVTKPSVRDPIFANETNPRRARIVYFFEQLQVSPEESKIIVLADRLHNIHCIPFYYRFRWIKDLSKAGVRKFDSVDKPHDKYLRMLRETNEFYLPFSKNFSEYWYKKFDERLREMCARIPPLFLKEQPPILT